MDFSQYSFGTGTPVVGELRGEDDVSFNTRARRGFRILACRLNSEDCSDAALSA
jgi:hypothetical protein